MTEKRVTEQEWFEWTNSVYGSRHGRLFIQQLFRMLRFWASPRRLIQEGFTPQEALAYESVAKSILNGLSDTNIADLFKTTRKPNGDD